MRVGRYFIVGLLVFGAIVGLVVAGSPRLRESPIPPAIWPVAVALLLDLALLPLARSGRIEPITMNERAIGVIGAAVIVTAILAASPAR
jgi:hypothetical protein